MISKTPIASIEAVSELMSVKSKDEKEKQQLAVIQAKATQIDALINNFIFCDIRGIIAFRCTYRRNGKHQID